MIAALVVTVLVNGSLVAASMPATLVAGTVAAPIEPFAQTIARRITTDSEHGRITFERDGRCLTVALGSRSAQSGRSSRALPIAPYLRDGRVIIPLAATARALGAAVYYNASARRVEIQLPAPSPLASMRPDRSWTPPPPPLATFAPSSAPAPAASVTGVPHPRRTPVLLNAND
jgi:hypothetical protein